MPRPQKAGLSYFPLDTDMEQDDKIALIEAKYGIVGFGLIIKLFKKIYHSNGYYCNWNEEIQLLFSKKIGIDFDKVIEIVNDAIRWELFDNRLFKKYKILTSKRIQKTYIDATSRRKEVEIVKEYIINGINDYINKVNVCIYSINVDNNKDINNILKKSKEKESKEASGINVYINPDNVDILNLWNSKEIIIHRSTKNLVKEIEKAYKKYGKDKIILAIENYYKVYSDPKYFYKHIWRLDKFLKQSNGVPNFLEDGQTWINYMNKASKSKVDWGEFLNED